MKEWGKMDATTVSSLPVLEKLGRKGRGPLPAVQLHQYLRMRVISGPQCGVCSDGFAEVIFIVLRCC